VASHSRPQAPKNKSDDFISHANSDIRHRCQQEMAEWSCPGLMSTVLIRVVEAGGSACSGGRPPRDVHGDVAGGRRPISQLALAVVPPAVESA
jgi:hypothetical protein